MANYHNQMHAVELWTIPLCQSYRPRLFIGMMSSYDNTDKILVFKAKFFIRLERKLLQLAIIVKRFSFAFV